MTTVLILIGTHAIAFILGYFLSGWMWMRMWDDRERGYNQTVEELKHAAHLARISQGSTEP